MGAEPPPPEINLFYAARSLAQDSYPTGNEVAARTFVRAFGFVLFTKMCMQTAYVPVDAKLPSTTMLFRETFRAEGVAAIKPVRDVYEDLSPRLVVYPVFLSAMLDVIVKTEMAKASQNFLVRLCTLPLHPIFPLLGQHYRPRGPQGT